MKTGYQFRSNGSSLDTESNYTQKQPYSVLAQPRPRRIQRTVSTSPLSVCHSGSSILAIFMVIISLLNVVSAQDDFLHQIARRGQSFVDLGARRLMERAAASTTASPSTSTTTSTSAIASATSTTLPQPFDTTLGNNFTTTSCPTFIVNFLSDITFQQCYPFSLLLQTSHAFFEDEKNFFQVSNALQAGCNVNFNDCNSIMSGLAGKIKSSENCGTEYADQNQIVMQAYNGLLAYAPMYQAGCLKDSIGDFCFADAITLRENASLADAYPYYLPVGGAMPVGTRPTCNSCLKNTMNVFRTYAANKTQPLSTTYVAAAQQINMACGPEYVADTTIHTSTSLGVAQSPIALLSFVITLFTAIFLI